jgi:hypothetical protein
MSSVSETFVREFFELHGFLVRQQRKYVGKTRKAADDIDFIVLNPQPDKDKEPLPFVLSSSDLAKIVRAVVVVKGWHTESFSPSVLANAPGIFKFVQPKAFKQTADIFGDDESIERILVVPALPKDKEVRQESIELLKSSGIDGILSFSTILSTLIDRIETNRNYQKSDLLQVIRVMKNYGFFRENQLELFQAKKRRSQGNA